MIDILLDRNTLERFISDIEGLRKRELREVLENEKIEHVKAVRAIDWILTRPKTYASEKNVDVENEK